MGRPKRWLACSLVLLPVACVFDSGAEKKNASIADTETDTEAGVEASGDPSGPQPTSGGQSGSAGATTGGGDSEDTGESEGSGDPTNATMPRADLVFVQPGPIDLGMHPLAGQDVMTLELINDGDAAGSILGGEDPPAPLLWAGGAFPGTNGTCQGLIPPGGTCTVTLAVGLGQPGIATGAVEVRFDDAFGASTAYTGVRVVSTGEGPNLIENADAEADPPGAILTGWDAGGSSFHTTDQHNHGTGSLSFFAGGNDNPELTQELMLSGFAESIDDLGLQFRFSGWSRARDEFWDDDPHGITLLFLDGTGNVLDSRDRGGIDDDGWEQTAWDVDMPAGTRRVRIRLSCNRNDNLIGNDNCSAWFDDFVGRLAYGG